MAAASSLCGGKNGKEQTDESGGRNRRRDRPRGSHGAQGGQSWAGGKERAGRAVEGSGVAQKEAAESDQAVAARVALKLRLSLVILQTSLWGRRSLFCWWRAITGCRALRKQSKVWRARSDFFLFR